MRESEQGSSWGVIEISIIVLIIGLCYAVWLPNRPGPRFSPANACINNLRQVDGAKNEWVLENNKTNADIIVTEADIKPFIKLNSKGQIPGCPAGGKYTIGKVGEPVTCSLSNAVPPHKLP